MTTTESSLRANRVNGSRGGRPLGARQSEENKTLRERALRYSDEMLRVLVSLARYSENPTVKLAAADKVLDRAHGRAPLTLDQDGKGNGVISFVVFTGVPEPDEIPEPSLKEITLDSKEFTSNEEET